MSLELFMETFLFFLFSEVCKFLVSILVFTINFSSQISFKILFLNSVVLFLIK
jgi:hypothetical protein